MIPTSPDFVQSFARGLSVIRSFSADSPSQSLSEVATATGLSRATARRFLHTLVDLGYAVTNGTQFQLTPRVLELGTSYLSALTLPAIAQPRLEALSREVGESSSMSVLDGTDIIYTYDNYEITASDEGKGAYLTAILLLNDGATTEGVKIGDDESKITATYGDDCESDGVQYTYEADGTQLIFLVQDGTIVSIEYRMAM